jgi:hypothetical protein
MPGWLAFMEFHIWFSIPLSMDFCPALKGPGDPDPLLIAMSEIFTSWR